MSFTEIREVDKNSFVLGKTTVSEYVKIVLGFVSGIFLSVASVLVACLQWKETNLQTRILLQQNEPVYAMNIVSQKDDVTGIYKNNILYIKNIGGIALEAQADVETWARVESFDNKSLKKNVADFLVRHYFFCSFPGEDRNKGILKEYHGANNNEKWANLDWATSKCATQKGCSLSLKLSAFVKISYKDIMGEKHVRYYEVDSFRSAEVDPDDKEKSIKNRFSTDKVRYLENKVIDLDTITPETFLSMIEKRGKPDAH